MKIDIQTSISFLDPNYIATEKSANRGLIKKSMKIGPTIH